MQETQKVINNNGFNFNKPYMLLKVAIYCTLWVHCPDLNKLIVLFNIQDIHYMHQQLERTNRIAKYTKKEKSLKSSLPTLSIKIHKIQINFVYKNPLVP